MGIVAVTLKAQVALAAVLAAVAATVLPKLQMCCRRPDSSSGSCLEQPGFDIILPKPVNPRAAC